MRTGPKVMDLSGRRFGRLVVIGMVEAGNDAARTRRWLCLCECGNHAVKSFDSLMRATGNSGCRICFGLFQAKQHRKHGATVGLKKTPLWICWRSMRQRCRDPNLKAYRWYGAKGVKVCDEWMKYQAFHDWAMANGYAPGLSIDRIDANGNYEPVNCRWVTLSENTLNMHRAKASA
jgi:hypothetical protein